MRTPRSPLALALLLLAAPLLAQTAPVAPGPVPSGPPPDVAAGMRWREIGPTRAGRARALSGVPSRPNEFWVGFDNGGVWRSTDYGSNWVPLFDRESTGSIGAIAVAPSDPNVVYVGTGAGIIRPDLATGDGVFKSTDGGLTWSFIGLGDSQMIAMIDVDPRDPNRLFVAALGHPYGPNAERGIFRSTDGGKSWQKVLYKDEYTSANDVRIDPRDPNVVYATLWQQQQSFIEGQGFGGAGNGIYKSTDGGTTWKQLTEGLPPVIQANIALAPSEPRTLYAAVAGASPELTGARATTGVVQLFRSTDAGEHWRLVVNDRQARKTGQANAQDPRPMLRIGGGDLPTLAVDPTNPNVVYSASIVMWRTEDGGVTWSAVRGAPGGDDYQKIWINPKDPKILLVVADQGAVVSGNRGESWSDWYNQNTAAMYHVSTDNAFPYRVCGGQQDSGSACVDSRSPDGEITFHDWHPVNIQEYGIAAPDPVDPDRVYGSARTNVSLYDRRTAQTTQVGPSAAQRGTQYGRNVRTMPIEWSRVTPGVLYYTSNVVWKSTDHAHSWTRISPDLARQTWAVPASAGKYASQVTVQPAGAITAFSASPLRDGVLWAGTDDGNVQTTSDGGRTWRTVTPPAVKPWTRIYNMDAGHFDAGTAYLAANTLRIDEQRPHFFRTHDGGRSWTEIDAGLPAGAASNSIREDPRQKGLLYAATDRQVWVSFDDGDHWESLRLDMPAISVRDLQVKDDSTCLCADLVAATHGRGFWILDDVTPLRQAAAARAARDAFLFKPVTAVRVRFASNDPTPWPPEVPHGENPPPGGIIDYMLARDAQGPVRIDILDAAGKVVRTYSSDDPRPAVDPARDPAAFDRACQEDPGLENCALPWYWPAPAQVISTAKGAHRIAWDLRFQPVGSGTGDLADDEVGGAVPHRTYPLAYAPWAPPGTYTVRLTANGQSYTQPLVLKLDPRVRTPAATLARVATLSRQLYDEAVALHGGYTSARALLASLPASTEPEAVARRARLDSLAPAPGARRPGFGPRGPATTLEGASAELLAAAMAMQAAETAPTAEQLAEADRVRARAAALLRRYRALESGPGR